jgi:DMSO/TMAO reductase YedYZ molybdopterin-dependent catalytic subunit
MKRRMRGLVAALLIAASRSFAADLPSQALDIKGNVATQKTYAPADLQALPQQDVELAAPDGGAQRVYRGVRLRDLIAAAKPIETGRFDLRQSIVVARATDGYLAIFSWVELFDSPIGDGVIVAWSRDGQPLGDGEGSFALVSARDTRSGPRHVRWLRSIELRRVSS